MLANLVIAWLVFNVGFLAGCGFVAWARGQEPDIIWPNGGLN